MRFSILVLTIFIASLSGAANAQQQWSNVQLTTVAQPGIPYVDIGGAQSATSTACAGSVSGGVFVASYCSGGEGLTLDQFANETDVTNRFAAVSSQLNSSNAATNAQFNVVNAQLSALQNGLSGALSEQNRSFGKAFDLIAASAALKDAVPNAGDRFALRINAGGFNGHIAGGVSGSINLNDQVRFSMNYAHGSSEQMFSGGLNFSFH